MNQRLSVIGGQLSVGEEEIGKWKLGVEMEKPISIF